MTADHLRCPRSSAPLQRLRIGGVDTDVCEDCGAAWLDRLELDRLQSHRDECPQCGGIWLDTDELAEIRR